MGILTTDEDFFSLIDMLRSDGDSSIFYEVFYDLFCDRVHEPRLSLSQVKCKIDRVFGKNLSSVFSMLAVKLSNFFAVKISESEGLDFDVKGAGSVEVIY